MDPALRIITQLPLRELWRNDGLTTSERTRGLTAEDIRGMLRTSRVHFVIADVGTKPQWIADEKCFDFWKTELQSHLASPETSFALEDFPGNYCYLASEWKGAEIPIVLCEKNH
jgi:hypothetical protein